VSEILAGGREEVTAAVGDAPLVRVIGGRGFGFLSTVVPDADALGDRAFRLSVERTYIRIGEVLRSRRLFPLRFWNYIPGIHRCVGGELRRYEVFNAGRFLGYTSWYGTGEFGRHLSAASAVGHRGRDLVVHALAAKAPGVPVENPRQIPAHRYSRRYGPLPPCFTRATLVERSLPGRDAPRWAIVAGTASIVGEESRHAEQIEQQLGETFMNLASISDAVVGGLDPGPLGARIDSDETIQALARYRELRVYLVRESDASSVEPRFRKAFPNLARLELATADLCRPELLIEAEGILHADL
jgi:chorismate lyase/3-hydroxybenzoate synthase